MLKKPLLNCCLCGDVLTNGGHSAYPVAKTHKRCCDDCNLMRVIPARLVQIVNKNYIVNENIKEGERNCTGNM